MNGVPILLIHQILPNNASFTEVTDRSLGLHIALIVVISTLLIYSIAPSHQLLTVEALEALKMEHIVPNY